MSIRKRVFVYASVVLLALAVNFVNPPVAFDGGDPPPTCPPKICPTQP